MICARCNESGAKGKSYVHRFLAEDLPAVLPIVVFQSDHIDPRITARACELGELSGTI